MNTELSKIIDLINASHYLKALEEIDRELNNSPNSFALNKAKATTLFLQKKYNSALVAFNKCYEINPNDYDVNVNISFIFNMIQDYKSSLKFCDAALKVNQDRPEVYHNIAHCYLYIPDLEKAEINVLKSIELRGGLESNDLLRFSDTLNLYTDILLAKGDLDKFNEISSKILNKNIFFGDMFRKVLRNNRSGITDDNLKILKSALNQIVDNKDIIKGTLSKASAYSCLAEYYQKLDKKISEDYYIESNKLILSAHRNSLYENQKFIKKIIKFFDSDETKTMLGNVPKNEGKGLIFIIGMPRSGTTLLESIIATADNCVAGGEKLFFPTQCPPIINNKSADTKEEDVFSRLGKDYLNIIDIQKRGRRFYIDKLPENYLYYKFIRNSLPGAKFLHIQRDPWDNATSIFKQNFQDALYWSSSFFGIALRYANYEYTMKLWQNEKNDDILDISYEELVSDTKNSINKIWGFCELEGNYDENKRKKHFAQTASKFQVTQNIYSSSLKKHEFEGQKEEFFENLELQRQYWSNSN
tara:strand:- start:501 stop:2087 length:1587 start_codon:yes stop_codon:yes gene_type:complete